MYISKNRFLGLKKGVTLIELLIGMFIFTLMIVAMTMVMVTILHRQSDIKAMQADTEEHSLIMGYLAKKIRMSTYGSGSGLSITVNDHNTATDTKFEFKTDAATSMPVLEENGTIIARNIKGSFSVVNNTNLATQIPRVTILLKKPDSIDSAVQTTVSLRSY